MCAEGTPDDGSAIHTQLNAESATTAEHDDFQGIHILVAEDNPSNQIVAEAMLQYIGCRTDMVATAETR